MREPRKRRRLLTASIGVATFTAFEGLACGNPIEPRYDPSEHHDHPTERHDRPADTVLDAGAEDAAGDEADAAAPASETSP